MKKEALALFMAACFAAIGVGLPAREPAILEEVEPKQTADEVEEKGSDDPPEEDGYKKVPFGTAQTTPYIVTADTLSQWRRVPVAPAFRINQADAVATMRAVASQAHLSAETVERLDEISKELTENVFEEHEKEEALSAAIDALFKSLHGSRTVTGRRSPPA